MKYFKHTTIQQYNSESHDAAPAVVYDNSQILHDDIVLTAQSNSELFTLMQTAGVVISTHSTYYTKADLGKITQTQFNSIQFSSSNIKTFNEFKYFTSVTTIPMNCFLNSSLSEITLHDNLILIAEYAFKQTNISKIILPDSITTLGMGAFEQCENLCEIKLSSNNNFTSISQSAFNNCQNLRSINITDNITSLNSSVFSSTKLSSINIPQSITVIPANAFAGTKIESLYIPEGVTEIGLNAFKDCTNLKNVIISSTVTTVQSGAFMNCTSLQHITCLATTAPQLTEINAITPFSGINIYGTLVYPESSDYSSWLSFGENFLGYFGWNDTIIATEASNKPFVDWAREQQWIPQNFNYMTSHQAASVTQLQFDNATKFIETNENITGRQSQYIDKIRYLNELRYFTKLTTLSSYGYHNNAFRFPNVVELTVPDTVINTFFFFFTADDNRLKKLTIPANFTNFRTIKEGTNPTYNYWDYFFADCIAEEIVFESETPPDFEIAFLEGFYDKQKNITIRYPYRQDTNYSDIYASLRTYINNNFEQSSTVICNVVEGIYENPQKLKVWHIDEDLSNYEIIISTSNLTYNGQQQEVQFTVEYEGSTLTPNVEYTVVNNSNKATNVGTYTLRIQGAGRYSGALSATWSISKYNITGKQFIPASTSFVYDGTQHSITLNTITIATSGVYDTQLRKNIDYTLSGNLTATNIGNYTVTITGTGNYTGTLTFNWEIGQAIQFSQATITWTNSPLTYNHEQQTAEFRVEIDGDILTSGDYTVTNYQATDAGTYTATFTGQGMYSGTKTCTWSISQLTPEITINDWNCYVDDKWGTVTATNESLVSGTFKYFVTTDSSVDPSGSYSHSTDDMSVGGNDSEELPDEGIHTEGTYYIWAYFVPDSHAINNYTYSDWTYGTLSVSRIRISWCDITVSSTSFVYDGTTHAPQVTSIRWEDVNSIYVNGRTLIENQDYELLGDTSASSVGDDYALAIHGIGDFYDYYWVSWEITSAPKIPISECTITWSSQHEFTYDGTAKEPTFTIMYNNSGFNETLTAGTDYTFAYENNTNAGQKGSTVTYPKITITGIGDYTGTREIDFIINKQTPGIYIANNTVTYDGQYHTCTAINVSSSSNRYITPGVLYHGAGSGPVFDPHTYGSINISNGESKSLTSISIADAGTHDIWGLFEPTDSQNWESKMVYAQLTIERIYYNTDCTCTLQYNNEPTPMIYDGREKNLSVSVTKNGTPIPNDEYTVTWGDKINAGTYLVYVTFIKNYMGTWTQSYSISGLSLVDTTIHLTDTTTWIDLDNNNVIIYDGLTHYIEYTITYNFYETDNCVFTHPLVEDEDYEIASNSDLSGTNEGVYYISITGLNNFDNSSNGTTWYILNEDPDVEVYNNGTSNVSVLSDRGEYYFTCVNNSIRGGTLYYKISHGSQISHPGSNANAYSYSKHINANSVVTLDDEIINTLGDHFLYGYYNPDNQYQNSVQLTCRMDLQPWMPGE